MTQFDAAQDASDQRIAVVIPCYKVRDQILGVLERMPDCVWRIYAVDDCCPAGSGDAVERNSRDPRVTVLRNSVNKGVGGAVMHGYARAVSDGATVIVKVDGDGQMDPLLIPKFVRPILRQEADYTKGNRFFDLRHISRMPKLRLFGNAALSFMSKFSTGYWDLFDPTNGYTAIDSRVAANLPFDKISERYFFETDMLFRLNTLRAVVLDIPMDANYGDEESNLRISDILGEFMSKHCKNFMRRIFYNYFLRDLSVASFELIAGLGLMGFGTIFGAWRWMQSLMDNAVTPVGTIMLAAVPVLVGLQLLLAFLAYDISGTPKNPIAGRLR